MQAPQSQLHPFQATIELFSVQEIEAMLARHLEAYYKYFCVRSDDLEGAALELAAIEATTAMKVLRGLFVHHAPFRTKETARAFLATTVSAKDKKFLSMFSTWMQDMMVVAGSENGVISRSGNTCEDIVAELDMFITNWRSVGDDEVEEEEEEEEEEDEGYKCPAYWPIVKIVKIGLRSALLARGLVLVDIPVSSTTLKGGDILVILTCHYRDSLTLTKREPRQRAVTFANAFSTS